jgi:amino-acid N-acetyltransferase
MSDKSFTIRRAQPADMPTIRAMVRREGLDPTQLKVEQFIVAETGEAGQPRIIGCGQMRHYPGACELGSLVVEPDWRGHGVGAALVRYLLAGTTGDVYLECRAGLVSYYRQFGFELVTWTELPEFLKVKFGLGRLLSLLPGVSIVSMRRVGPSS